MYHRIIRSFISVIGFVLVLSLAASGSAQPTERASSWQWPILRGPIPAAIPGKIGSDALAIKGPVDAYKQSLAASRGVRPPSDGLTIDEYYAKYPSQNRGTASRASLVVNYYGDVNSYDASPGNGVCADPDGLCGLRAAVMEASALNNGSSITIPAGVTINLVTTGVNENAGYTGDLDISGDLYIVGGGADNTVINANGIDRVFDVFGGALINIYDVTIMGGDASLDTTWPYGGGLWIDCNGDVLLQGVNVYYNAAFVGGGIKTGSDCDTSVNNLYLFESAVYGNAAVSGAGGVDIYQSGYASFRNATISNNYDQAGGTGLFIEGDSTNPAPSGNITHTTIADNTSSGTIGGNGLYLEFGASVTIANSILGYNRYGSPTVLSDCGVYTGATLTSTGDNVYTSATCPTGGADVIDSGLSLGILSYNYPGATPTNALFSDSSAVNLDSDLGSCPSFDQRGVARPQLGNCDAGAYEYSLTSTELIGNGGFEDGTLSPWVLKNGSGDKLLCKPGTPHTGSCDFRFKGNAGERSKIQQISDISALTFSAGDGVALSVWLKTANTQPGKIKTVVSYSDGSRYKITGTLEATSGYSHITGNLNIVGSNVTKVKTLISFLGISGKVYLDDISLVLIPGGATVTENTRMTARTVVPSAVKSAPSVLPLPQPSGLTGR